ncbi:MAG: hypothetical protein AAF571_15035 [Verrucomicrobiota bacterium]
MTTLIGCSSSVVVEVEPYGSINVAEFSHILNHKSDYQEFLHDTSPRNYVGLSLALIQKEHPDAPITRLEYLTIHHDGCASSRNLDDPTLDRSIAVSFIDPDSIELIEDTEKARKWRYTRYSANFYFYEDPESVHRPFYSQKSQSIHTRNL